jgi:hypothetical protein
MGCFGAARKGEANLIHVGHADLGQYLALLEVGPLIAPNFAIPNDRIEQMARKNDGAAPTQSRSDGRRLPRRATEIRHGRRTARAGSRTKLMQHWADRIDHWLDPKKVMPIKGGALA